MSLLFISKDVSTTTTWAYRLLYVRTMHLLTNSKIYALVYDQLNFIYTATMNCDITYVKANNLVYQNEKQMRKKQEKLTAARDKII